MTAEEVKNTIQLANPNVSDELFAQLEMFAQTAAQGMFSMIQREGGSMTRFAVINVMALATLSHFMHCSLEGINPDVDTNEAMLETVDELIRDLERKQNKETIH